MVTINELRSPSNEDISPFEQSDQNKWHVIAVKGAPDVS